MTNHKPPPTDAQQLQFYITPAHECPYLAQKKSKTVFLNPELAPDQKVYRWLIDNGFRRSGDHIYRPQCDDCNECVSVRIKVENFLPNKQQKRCAKKGKGFITKIYPASFDKEHYRLFENYINARHQDGDMYPTSEKQYKDFVLSDWINTQFIDFIEPTTGRLVACCVFDQLESGLSAIYTFYDNEYAKFSLGRLAVLTLIENSIRLKLPYVYLGYWIKNCQKMSYKGEYRPIECFINQRWIHLS